MRPAIILAALLAAGSGAWVWGRWGGLSRSRSVRIAAGCIALFLLLGGSAAVIAASRGNAALEQAATGSSAWEPWSPERVAALRGQGTPVFVDFTARWCLSCQVNERVALSNAAVQKRFRDLGVATLRADWTDRSDAIAGALAGFGRAGVPVYALYGRGNADPVLLPEILTPGIVLSALEAAR